MMKTLLINIWLLLQVVLCVSCNKWLDVKPASEMEREDLYDSEDGFKSSLSGCYIALKNVNLYGQSMTMTTVEYLAQHWHTESEDVANFMDFDWEADYSKGQMSTIFSNMYNVINQVNDLLIQLDKKGEEAVLKEEIRNLIKGEALAMRAFCHFDILRLFGPSPKDPNKASVQLPYSEQSGKEFRPYYAYDMYCKKLLNDLHEAEFLLEQVDPVLELTFEELNNPNQLLKNYKIVDDFQAYRRLRFNYWAVKALEARIALYLGDTETAYKSAKLVIDARVQGEPVGDISAFNMDFSNKYYTLPSETLLALNVFDLDEKIQSIFRNAQTVLYNWETESDVLTNLFEDETSDVRNALWVPMDYESQRKVGIRKYWQLDEEEFEDVVIYGQQIPLLRMSEMYLIAIETAPTLVEGNALLDIFRRDRGLLSKTCVTKEDLNAAVLKEYQKEFYAEGQMFFQYKRIGAESMNWKDDRIIEISEYQIPLPETEYMYQ